MSGPSGAAGAQSRLVLTPHPLQRIGAYAVAALAHAAGPEEVPDEEFDAVVQRMISDLIATSTVGKGDPGWYLFGVSYVLWPNCALHYQSKRSSEGIAKWRSMPPSDAWPGVPCTLCGRSAAAWYGKGDIPLGASIEHRNTTAPDHQGTALCWPCVTSFHALPYACAAGGGVLAGLHSWSEGFMARATKAAVTHNLQAMITRGDLKKGGGAFTIEFAALHALRWWDKRMTDGLQAIQFSNNNQDQKFQVEDMDQPLAEWLRSTVRDRNRRAGFRYLAAAQATAKVRGLRMLAWRAFNRPQQIPTKATQWLKDRSEDGTIPVAVLQLAPLIRSYLTEVLHVLDKDVGHVNAVAGHIAEVIIEPGHLKTFMVATRQTSDLKSWLKKQATDWTLTRSADGPFIDTVQWRALFDMGNSSWSARDLLYVAVLEQLCARGWKPKPDDDTALDDIDFTTLDTENAEEN